MGGQRLCHKDNGLLWLQVPREQSGALLLLEPAPLAPLGLPRLQVQEEGHQSMAEEAVPGLSQVGQGSHRAENRWVLDGLDCIAATSGPTMRLQTSSATLGRESRRFKMVCCQRCIIYPLCEFINYITIC